MSARLRALPWLLAGLALACGAGCVPVPAHFAGPVEGVVVDAESGAPLEGALVVVRFEGSYDDVLPDFETLGHTEARSDAAGRFRTRPFVAGGWTVWPWLRVRARVATARHPGHRCADELGVAPGAAVRVALAAAVDSEAERSSCRPVPAPPRQTPLYTAAWRALHPEHLPAAQPSIEPARERELAARTSLGFGGNCRGPVLDLALSPDARRAALLVGRGAEVEVRLVELATPAADPLHSHRVARASAAPARRLLWTGPRALALESEPLGGAAYARRGQAAATSPVWRERSLPAAPDGAGWAPLPPVPEGPALGAETAREGRSFALRREPDAEHGRLHETLVVSRADGARSKIALPGEACAGGGRFGRPEERLAADGRTALDLRWVEGGCRAVALDLESGTSARIDVGPGGESAGACAEARHLPRAQLDLALPDYARALDARLREAGADPAAAFRLRIDATGDATVETVDLRGRPRALPAPPFPVATPLRRLEIGVLAPAAEPGGPPPVESAPPRRGLLPL